TTTTWVLVAIRYPLVPASCAYPTQSRRQSTSCLRYSHWPTYRRGAELGINRAETSIVLLAAAFFFVAILGDVLIDDRAALFVCLLAGLARGLATNWRRLIGRAAE